MSRRVGFISVLVVALLGIASLRVAAQSNRTFYIDYASGSNSNSGTMAAPWKTHPYMQTAAGCTETGSAPAYSHQAGDHFVFKGGVTWPAACFQMILSAGGSSSARDYYGVDKGWYEGNGWTRPLFNLNGQVPAGNHVIYASASFSGFTTFDNLEIANQQVQLGHYAADDAYNFFSSANSGILITNNYIHDWFTNCDLSGGAGTCAALINYSTGAIFGKGQALTLDHTEISDVRGSAYSHGVIISQALGGACAGCGTVQFSKIHNTMSACFVVPSCHDNEFYGISQGCFVSGGCQPNSTYWPHSQVIEDDNPCDSSNGIHSVIYNNAIHDNHAGVNIFVRYDSTIYNNVMWNNTNNYNIRLCHNANDSSSVVGHIYNNTIDSGSTSPIGAQTSTGQGTLYIVNNAFVTWAADYLLGIATVVDKNNHRISASEASTYGFTSATKYAPTSSDPNIVGKGVDFASSCGGDFSQLCSDTSGAPWFGASTYTPRSGSWDLGAYATGTQSSSNPKPNAPTALTAVVQ